MRRFHHGDIAQLVERLNGIEKVRGSTPLISTIPQVPNGGRSASANDFFKTPLRGAGAFGILSAVFRNGEVAQMVEHHVRNVRVGGSNPLFSTIFRNAFRPIWVRRIIHVVNPFKMGKGDR